MSNAKYDVLGIGNAIVDVLSRAEDAFLTQHGLIKGAMQLIDEAQAQALYAEMAPAVEISGGSAAHTIAGIASLGGRTAFFGKVRNDQLGDVFSHDIRSLGVAFETQAATETLAFLAEWIPAGASPMCGNSICQDRRFMARHLPELEAYFHYRNLDVSTLKILASRWRPDLPGLAKKNVHLALEDIRESIVELGYYREHFLQTPE